MFEIFAANSILKLAASKVSIQLLAARGSVWTGRIVTTVHVLDDRQALGLLPRRTGRLHFSHAHPKLLADALAHSFAVIADGSRRTAIATTIATDTIFVRTAPDEILIFAHQTASLSMLTLMFQFLPCPGWADVGETGGLETIPQGTDLCLLLASEVGHVAFETFVAIKRASGITPSHLLSFQGSCGLFL